MLPKRRTNTDQTKDSNVNKKITDENVILELRSQIVEEKEKRKNKVVQPAQESYKTPLVNKTLTKKNTLPKVGQNSIDLNVTSEVKSSTILPEQKIEKKYTETVTGGTEPIYSAQQKLQPTGFTYFDILTERDIMLSDSDS